MGPQRPGRWRRLALGVGAAALLGAVFVAYRNPHLMVDLASRLWACF